MAAGEREILTLREASEFLNCHPSTVYRLVKSSQIPAFRLGGSWRFVKPELHRWIRGLTEWPQHEGDESAKIEDQMMAKTVRSSPPARRYANSSAAGAESMSKGRRASRRH
jgi:excisionase family DNA binding protein